MKITKVLTLSFVCKTELLQLLILITFPIVNFFTTFGTTQHCEYIQEQVLLTLQVMIMI